MSIISSSGFELNVYMNKNIICPDCKAKLQVDHYSTDYKRGLVLYRSRLICAKCGYAKEGRLPENIYSEMFPRELRKIWD